MKNKIIQYTLISSLILLSTIAESASIYDPSLTIFPNPQITTEDAVYAELRGHFATSGFSIDYPFPLVILLESSAGVEGYVGINFRASSPNGNVLTTLTPFSVNANIGQLNAGIYNVNAEFYVDDILAHTVKDSFTVSAVPLPAAVWLFGSSLVALFSLNRKSRTTA